MDERVALLGCGRFGRALGERMESAGLSVRAYDPSVEVPPAWRAGSPAKAVAGADVVVLAVPVPVIPDVLRELRPHLLPTQLVLDVGSVKVRPQQAMAEVLGPDVPWVGTHPLFGPESLARGERPLRVVVCPNMQHLRAAPRASALYTRLGCEVETFSADFHDELMARTHALPLFLGQGLRESGAGAPAAVAPPCFQAVTRLVEAARSEAPHLLTAVQVENPYARELRELLLDVLGHVHAGYLAQEGAEAPAPQAEPSPELAAARARIDALDRELLALLARRVEAAEEAARIKAASGLPVFDPTREAQLVEERRRWAAEMGLGPDAVAAVFRALLRLTRRTLRQALPPHPGHPRQP